MSSEVSVNMPGNLWSQSWRRKRRRGREGFAEKEGLKPWCERVRGDGQMMRVVSRWNRWKKITNVMKQLLSSRAATALQGMP